MAVYIDGNQYYQASISGFPDPSGSQEMSFGGIWNAQAVASSYLISADASATLFGCQIRHRPSGVFRSTQYDGGFLNVQSGSSAYAADGNWQWAGASFADEDNHSPWYDTTIVSQGSGTQASITSNRLTVGSDGSGAANSDVELAEIFVLDRQITAADLSMLAAGYSPLFFLGNGLWEYWPFHTTGNQVGWIRGITLTETVVSGSVLQVQHPPIIYPDDESIFVPAAAGGTTASGAFSSDGLSSNVQVGAALSTGLLSSLGIAANNQEGAATASGVINAAGEASADQVGAVLATGVINADGISSNDMVGVTAISGAMSSDGVAVGILTGSSTASGVLSSDGEAAAGQVGRVTVTSVINADGVSSNDMVGSAIGTGSGAISATGIATGDMGGASLASGLLSADGVSVNDQVGSSASLAKGAISAAGTSVGAMRSDIEDTVEPEVAIAVPDGGGGAWARASSKRKKQIKQEDEELMMVIKHLAPQIMRHRRTLH